MVTIAEQGTTPPFDIGPQRTKFYKNTLGGVQDFKPKLRAAAKAALDEEHEPDNPIYRIREDFQMREAVAGDDKMGYLMNRLDDIETAISNPESGFSDEPQIFWGSHVPKNQLPTYGPPSPFGLELSEELVDRLQDIPEIMDVVLIESPGIEDASDRIWLKIYHAMSKDKVMKTVDTYVNQIKEEEEGK